MTFQVDGVDVVAAIELAAWVGSIVSMLVIGLIVYLMVRPPRRLRGRDGREPDETLASSDEMIRLLDRMERRVSVLERAVEAEAEDRKRISNRGQSPRTRRVE